MNSEEITGEEIDGSEMGSDEMSADTDFYDEEGPPEEYASDFSQDAFSYDSDSGDFSSRGFRGVFPAVLTGLAAAAAFLVCYFIGNIALLILISVVLGAAAVELLTNLKKVGYSPAILLCLVIVVGITPAVYWRGASAYVVLLPLAIFFVALWYLFVESDNRVVPHLSSSLFVIFYIAVPGGTAALLLAAPNDYGPNLILTAILAAVSYDVGGWLVGKLIGRIKITHISPNKTLEGLIAGMIFAVAVPTLVLQALNLEPFGASPGSLSDVIILGVVAAIVAPLGDLIESLIKRNLGIKDMGTILPGHGGVLDRIDALLFVLPATLLVAEVLDLVQII